MTRLRGLLGSVAAAAWLAANDLAFIRADGDERMLVVANLSRFAQYVDLDLSAFRGAVPGIATGAIIRKPYSPCRWKRSKAASTRWP